MNQIILHSYLLQKSFSHICHKDKRKYYMKEDHTVQVTHNSLGVLMPYLGWICSIQIILTYDLNAFIMLRLTWSIFQENKQIHYVFITKSNLCVFLIFVWIIEPFQLVRMKKSIFYWCKMVANILISFLLNYTLKEGSTMDHSKCGYLN